MARKFYSGAEVQGLLTTTGGINIGGTADPGAGNLQVGGASNSNLVILPTAASSTTLKLASYNDSSSGRNWALRNRYNAQGVLELMYSTSVTGDALTTAMSFHPSGGVVIGSGFADPGAGRFAIATSVTPASAGATGLTGTVAWDANYIYICVATNTWKRAAISTF
jgi:hypothetical protein